MNDALELHDSTLADIIQEEADIVLRLTPAIVHRTSGAPGINPGSVWLQDVEVRVLAGIIQDRPESLQCWLADGELAVGDENWDNVIPIPLARRGEVSFRATTDHGETFVVRGSGDGLLPRGEAKYVEEWR